MLAEAELQPNGFIKLLIYDVDKQVKSSEEAECVGGDILAFINDKYVDKNVMEEWGKIDRQKRIKYYKRQIEKLENLEKISWNEHGTGVE
jgi:hypothetical protein